MSLVSWIFVSIACICIVAFGYVGVTGKSIFPNKNSDNKRSHH